MQLFLWEYSRFLHQVQPEDTFVRFFKNDSEFRYELGTRTRTTRCPVVCSDGSTRALQLFAQDAGFLSFGQGSIERDESKREALRSALKTFEILYIQTLAFVFSPRRDCAHVEFVWFYFFNLTSDF